MVLVGNKCDLEDERKVTVEMAKNFAASKNMDFFETSAKTADHVQEGFINVAKKLLSKVEKSGPKPVKQEQQNTTLRPNLPPPQKKGCCG